MSESHEFFEHQSILYGCLHDCPDKEPSDIHAHLCNSFHVEQNWKYATTSQIHSDIIREVSADWKTTSPSFGGCVGDGDALITSEKNVFLCTRTADCVPIFLFAKDQIAVIHAGWRGIAQEIVQKCCTKMDCIEGAIIGPCISQRNYEVGIDVIDAFEAVQILRDDVAIAYTDVYHQPKFLLDVQLAVKIQLMRFGLEEAQIINSTICTFESDIFHSYRRDGKKAGRNWSCIALR